MAERGERIDPGGAARGNESGRADAFDVRQAGRPVRQGAAEDRRYFERGEQVAGHSRLVLLCYFTLVFPECCMICFEDIVPIHRIRSEPQRPIGRALTAEERRRLFDTLESGMGACLLRRDRRGQRVDAPGASEAYSRVRQPSSSITLSAIVG